MDEYVPCPKCGSSNAEKVWIIWSGLIVPRLLNHVKCKDCGITYNGKTGQLDILRLILYNAVTLVIVIFVILIGFILYF